MSEHGRSFSLCNSTSARTRTLQPPPKLLAPLPLHLPKPPVFALEIRIAPKLITQPLGMLHPEPRPLHARPTVQPEDQLAHALPRATHQPQAALPHRHPPPFGQPPDGQRGLGLAILAEERRVDDDAVEAALELLGQPQRLRKVVQREVLLEHPEALVVLEQPDCRARRRRCRVRAK